jgi:hypothetical protein
LDVAEGYAGVEGGGDEGVTQSVGSDPLRDPGLATLREARLVLDDLHRRLLVTS